MADFLSDCLAFGLLTIFFLAVFLAAMSLAPFHTGHPRATSAICLPRVHRKGESLDDENRLTPAGHVSGPLFVADSVGWRHLRAQSGTDPPTGVGIEAAFASLRQGELCAARAATWGIVRRAVSSPVSFLPRRGTGSRFSYSPNPGTFTFPWWAISLCHGWLAQPCELSSDSPTQNTAGQSQQWHRAWNKKGLVRLPCILGTEPGRHYDCRHHGAK